jgi:transcriptional regulator
MEVEVGPYARMLAGIRGRRLTVVGVTAKFKYDDHKPAEHRQRVAGRLAERGLHQDQRAREEQLRRLTMSDG